MRLRIILERINNWHIDIMNKKVTVVIILLLLNAGVMAQLPDSIRSYIDSSLSIIKENSLYASRVNWSELTPRVYEAARTATSKEQTFSALKIAFEALGDKHAQYYQYNDEHKYNNTALQARQTDSLKAAWTMRLGVRNLMMGNIAYINIPYIGVGKQKDIDAYANYIYDTIAKLQQQQPKGWIIDLRVNGGGNIRPMLAGLAMFFEDGVVSYYIDRNGKATDEAAFSNGDFLMDGKVQAAIKNKIPRLKPVKVAVLIGPGTASSGEGVATVFRQRRQTRLFGKETAGLANATNGFVFNNNISYFLISTASLGDKNKKVLPETVKPDVKVETIESFANITNDATVKEAVKWLRKN